MITAWTKHIKDPQEKEQFEKSIRHSKWILDHLSGLVKEMDTNYENSALSPKVYDQPNWEYRQAHCNGFRQCLRTINRLITLDPEEHNERST